MQQRTVIIVIALVAFFLIGGVAACKHGRHPGGFDEFDLAAAIDRAASRLDLTERQKAELDRMAREIAAKAKAMHADHASRHQALADLVRQDAIGPDLIDSLITEKLAKMRELADFTAERLIAFHATLTPEQRETIATRIEDHASGGCRFGWR